MNKKFLAILAFGTVVAFAGVGQVQAQTSAQATTLEDVMSDLRGGGMVILMRHANSPSGQSGSVGMTKDCVLQNGRGLDSEGFFQARFIGEFFRDAEVPIGGAFTSDMCRAWDTARLVAGNTRVVPSQALKTTNLGTIDAFKATINGSMAADPSTNFLLVSHSNIVPLYSDWGNETEIPSGVVLLVDPKDWTVKNKLNLNIDLSAGTGGATQ